ncbi:MAG: hypothetical protein CME62_03490 [Halobacteriovoraceae bacterium]|nr:hypothetical protein [Halobacteriovoraceae bacterium]|tara:strand:+ start:42587 stop:43321 length:735 start_codon:yes stop_codon:yes gene_type:complete
MKVILTLPLFIMSLALAQVSDSTQLKTLRDVEHEIPGCPINSICDKERGKQIKEFETILKISNSEKRHQKLKTYAKNTGLPLRVLTPREPAKKENVILWDSRCKIHNPINPNDKIFQGLYITKDIPLQTKLHFDSVYLFEGDEIKEFKVPYRDKPLFMKNNKLFFLKDYDDQLYQISLNEKGKFNIENLDANVFTMAQSRRVKEVPCPENKKAVGELHTESYCQKIWDIDTNKLKLIQVFWSCP